MAEIWTRTASEHAAAGRQALEDARWEAARTAFRQAIAEDETPEALEGLSWAAWWLDDEAVVFAARRRAHALYRARGDAAAAGRTAVWLAIDELDFHGAAAPASGWLRRAHRLLDDLPPGPAHGWLAFQDGYVAHSAHDTATALGLARRAADLGRRHRVADLEMLGLALEGASLVAAARVPEGMRCLDEAVTTALERRSEVPISCAWTFCLLVSSCLAVLDLDRAATWCERIAEFADRYGSRYMLAFCRAEHGVVHRWRGRWDEAERSLEAAVEDFSHSRPAWAPGPLAALAELRRLQGRPQVAARLLEIAAGSVSAQVCRAALALDDGRALDAVHHLERALRRIPRDRLIDRAPALTQLVRARLACGRLDAANAALVELRAAARAAGTVTMGASADLATGLVLAARRDHDAARRCLEDAVDGFEAAGAPHEAAWARVELAGALAALGHGGAAEAELRTGRRALATLGARAPGPHEGDGPRTAVDALAVLSRREREVVVLLGEGLTNREIAGRLVLSEHTVHRHVSNLLAKLDVSSRSAAAALAARAGPSPGE